MPHPPDDPQGPDGLQCGDVVTAHDIKQRCVDDLKKVPYDEAPEELAKIIIKAVLKLSAIEGIINAERFKQEMPHAIKEAAAEAVAEAAANKAKARGLELEEWEGKTAKQLSSQTPQDQQRPGSDEGNRDERSDVVTNDEDCRGMKPGMKNV